MDRPLVLTLLGTRPEVIKLAPVVRALEASEWLHSRVVHSGQHGELADSFVDLFGLSIEDNLNVMREAQSPTQVAHRLLEALAPLLEEQRPALMLVQGDTTTAFAGALAAFYAGIPVGHVEAGLRTDHPRNPFPEEMNRRLISRLATLHFAATEANRAVLLAEGVPDDTICVSGNPVVDSLEWVLDHAEPSSDAEKLAYEARDHRLVLMTTHRRESFDGAMEDNLHALRRFVERHSDAMLVFPVHPNPAVREVADRILAGVPRVRLLPPLGYADFTYLLGHASLVCSDSGGVQEEAPSLGVPLLVLRQTTERPEALAAGVARLVDGGAAHLERELETAWRPGSWVDDVFRGSNPFGDGRSGERIAAVAESFLGVGPCATAAGDVHTRDDRAPTPSGAPSEVQT